MIYQVEENRDKGKVGLHSWAFLVICVRILLSVSRARSDEERDDAVTWGELICKQNTYFPYK